MIGLGTVINVAGIIVGGIIGLFIGNKIKQRFQDIIIIALGLGVIFISVADIISKMIVIKGSKFEVYGSFMMILALVLGAIVGEIINLEKRTEQLGEWLKKKSGSQKDNKFVDGFVTTSFTVCIGAMAIIGSINDGLLGDYSILITKSILDTVMVLVMASSYGKGCVFSALPVLVLQGSVTALSKVIEPIMTETALKNLSIVGSVLIFCVGINLTFGKRIKVANLLPAIIFAVIFAFVPFLK